MNIHGKRFTRTSLLFPFSMSLPARAEIQDNNPITRNEFSGNYWKLGKEEEAGSKDEKISSFVIEFEIGGKFSRFSDGVRRVLSPRITS